jgi:hypothetical protein
MKLQAFHLCSTGQDGFNLSYESLTSRKTQNMLFERVGTDQEFFQSLKRVDDGEEEADQGDGGNDDGMVCYDEIDSSKTINEAIQDIVESAPAGCLADIYADKEDGLNESDVEDRGAGINLDMYTGRFSTRDATRRWMEWDGE